MERAIDWAVARLGSLEYPLRCLAFVEDAFERANGIEMFGGSSATESADLYGVHRVDADPPRGAFVFYRCAGPIGGRVEDWGHVGLSLGDGRIIHAWDRVRIDLIDAVQGLAPSPGWTRPRLIGWTPPERVLAGHRRHAWDDER